MYIVYVWSDILTIWINGPILLGTNVVHLSGVHCIYGQTRLYYPARLCERVKSTETREELSTNCNPKVMSRCLSAPDATSLHHSCSQPWVRGFLRYIFQLHGAGADLDFLKGGLTGVLPSQHIR